MKCPHCLENLHEEYELNTLGSDSEMRWKEAHCTCASCHRMVVHLIGQQNGVTVFDKLVYPNSVARIPIPKEVDDQIVVNDYTEACNVLAESAQASAALSRKALQYILRNKIKVPHSSLSKEIQIVIDKNLLPVDLSEQLDVVRSIGNFAAHPIKSQSTGEIVSVEPGEAEWNLDVLEELIEYVYVRPARINARKEKLNEKLADAGKPEIK